MALSIAGLVWASFASLSARPFSIDAGSVLLVCALTCETVMDVLSVLSRLSRSHRFIDARVVEGRIGSRVGAAIDCVMKFATPVLSVYIECVICGRSVVAWVAAIIPKYSPCDECVCHPNIL